MWVKIKHWTKLNRKFRANSCSRLLHREQFGREWTRPTHWFDFLTGESVAQLDWSHLWKQRRLVPKLSALSILLLMLFEGVDLRGFLPEMERLVDRQEVKRRGNIKVLNLMNNISGVLYLLLTLNTDGWSQWGIEEKKEKKPFNVLVQVVFWLTLTHTITDTYTHAPDWIAITVALWYTNHNTKRTDHGFDCPISHPKENENVALCLSALGLATTQLD